MHDWVHLRGFFNNEQFTVSLIMHMDVALKLRLETLSLALHHRVTSVCTRAMCGVLKHCLFQEDLSYLLATFGMSNSRNTECVIRSWFQMKYHSSLVTFQTWLWRKNKNKKPVCLACERQLARKRTGAANATAFWKAWVCGH